MHPLTALFKQVEARIRELESDLQKIKDQIQNLMEENAALREQLAVVYGQEGKNKPEENPGGAFENLKNLYERGFHVCNLYFGHLHQEECLFCLAFLERGGKSQL